MVDADGDWKWELFRHRFPTQVLLRIAAIQRPKPSFHMDSIGWKLRDDRQFSIRTAYHVRCGEELFGCRSVALGYRCGYGVSLGYGMSAINVESDSSDALRMLQQRSSEVCSYLIGSHIHQLCKEDWQIVFSKVARCNNGVADGLAKLASDSSFDVVFFDEPSGGIETG
ncbi:hypothetical protein V6N11_072351 [Hibiscus sabdariffa]|uniref:RNase H type-1 domain-containing protein n=1 Tax=Hibiscus sabdariffa TaxID=183260 RepID=A0ABR2U3I6_9ROSI